MYVSIILINNRIQNFSNCVGNKQLFSLVCLKMCIIFSICLSSMGEKPCFFPLLMSLLESIQANNPRQAHEYLYES